MDFGMDNVAVVNSRGKITRSCDENMGLDIQFIHNNIARVLHNFLNQTKDVRLLIDVLRDYEHFMSNIIHILIFSIVLIYINY